MDQPEHPREYASTTELERRYPVIRVRTWQKWVHRGRIRGAVKPFGRILIPLDEVERLMHSEGGQP